MKIAGHTLGTPQLTVVDALSLFAAVGCDGAEVIWQDDYRSAIPETDGASTVSAVKRVADELGLEIAGLTPYMTGLASLDPGERSCDIDRFRSCIAVAAALECHRVRVYAGAYRRDDVDHRDTMWANLTDSLQTLAVDAAAAGVTLCVENHFNTLTTSAVETASLVEAVGSPNVGILYDQANLTFTHNEAAPEAIALQSPWIRHVHVKDLVFIDAHAEFASDSVATVDPSVRAVRSRVVGDGILDWSAILAMLRSEGYDGYLSLEYEYRWHPQDLPAPQEGIARSVRALRRLLDGNSGGAR